MKNNLVGRRELNNVQEVFFAHNFKLFGLIWRLFDFFFKLQTYKQPEILKINFQIINQGRDIYRN